MGEKAARKHLSSLIFSFIYYTTYLYLLPFPLVVFTPATPPQYFCYHRHDQTCLYDIALSGEGHLCIDRLGIPCARVTYQYAVK